MNTENLRTFLYTITYYIYIYIYNQGRNIHQGQSLVGVLKIHTIIQSIIPTVCFYVSHLDAHVRATFSVSEIWIFKYLVIYLYCN